MSDREHPFDKAAACDRCGAKGAFDIMGDLVCQQCLPDTRTPSRTRAAVYCVVVVAFRDGRFHRGRTWGWFPTEQEAVDCIQHDAQFLHENAYYRWALVERVPAGLCQDSEVRGWFVLRGRRAGKKTNGHLDEWTDGYFSLVKQPRWAAHICNWSMG